MNSGYIPTWQPHDPYQNIREALVGEDIELYRSSAVFKAWVDAMAQALELQRQGMVMACSENEYLRTELVKRIKNEPMKPVVFTEDDLHEAGVIR
jgi:hypothetical protein